MQKPWTCLACHRIESIVWHGFHTYAASPTYAPFGNYVILSDSEGSSNGLDASLSPISRLS